jgi:anti-anti-sigma factor
MKIDREEIGNTIVLTPRERIDNAAAQDFQLITLEAVRGKPARLVIDLDAIDYIASAGLRVLLLAAKESRAIGVVCALCSPRPPVLKLFETTGLIRIFTILPNRMAALVAI